MSIKFLNLVWEADLPAMRKLILLRLASHADEKGGSIFPSVESVARSCGLTDRAVRNAIKSLRESGVLVLVKASVGGRGHANIYRIDLETLNLIQGLHDEKAEPHSGFRVGNPEPRSINPEPRSPHSLITKKEPSDSVAAPHFEDFWRTYPSRRPHSNPKLPARKKFDAALKRGVPAADINRGAANFAKYVARERIEPKFIAHATTWLNLERWTEYQVEPAPAKPTAAGWL